MGFQGVNRLAELRDTSIPSPSDNDLLYFDAATEQWKARTLMDADIPSEICRDTEADSKIATHAAISGEHHARYTDTEAVSAMGAKADANPLNHDKYTHPSGIQCILTEPDIPSEICRDTEADSKIATHAAISGEHHARYTDTEAVSAMGVKGDSNPLNHDKYEHPAAIQCDHSGRSTGIHGVGSDYVAIAEGLQYIALRGAGATQMRSTYYRSNDTSQLRLYGGTDAFSPYIEVRGKSNSERPYEFNWVWQVSEGVWEYVAGNAMGSPDPYLRYNVDNKMVLGDADHRWKEISAVTVTEGDICFEEKDCHICGRQFKVGDGFGLVVIEVDEEYGHQREVKPGESKKQGRIRAVPICVKCLLKEGTSE